MVKSSRKSGPGVLPSAIAAKAVTFAARREQQAAVCLATAEAALAGFGRGGHIFGLTKGQFSMIDLAAAVLRRTGSADVAVWTWCIADYEVAAISGFIENGSVASFRMVMDWAGAQRDTPLVADLQARFGNDCIRVTKTHAKIVHIGTEDGWRVVVRGSMNLNANPRFEQFDVSDDVAIFDVVGGVMQEIWVKAPPLPVRAMVHSDAAVAFGSAAEASGAKWMPGQANWWA